MILIATVTGLGTGDTQKAGQPSNYLRQIFLAGWAGTDEVLVSGMLERERERECVETNNVQIFIFRNFTTCSNHYLQISFFYDYDYLFFLNVMLF